MLLGLADGAGSEGGSTVRGTDTPMLLLGQEQGINKFNGLFWVSDILYPDLLCIKKTSYLQNAHVLEDQLKTANLNFVAKRKVCQ